MPDRAVAKDAARVTSRRTRSISASSDSSVRLTSASPARMSSASFRFSAIISSMRSSTVPVVMNLCTSTLRRWPMRKARSVAWFSTAGFHQRSKWTTCDAAVRFRPVPPALSDRMKNGGPSSVWNRATRPRRSLTPVAPCSTSPGSPENRRQVLGQRIDDLAELGEHQHLLLAFGQLFADLRQAKKLAAVGGPVLSVAEKLAGVVADLLQAQERAQHHAAPGDVDGGLHLPLHGPHHLPVELDLGPGQVAVAGRLRLLRQVVDDRAVGLEAAQDVRADQAAAGARRGSPRAPAGS